VSLERDDVSTRAGGTINSISSFQSMLLISIWQARDGGSCSRESSTRGRFSFSSNSRGQQQQEQRRGPHQPMTQLAEPEPDAAAAADLAPWCSLRCSALAMRPVQC